MLFHQPSPDLDLTPGYALTLFTQAADVRTAIPIEERLRVSAEAQMHPPPGTFCASKKLDHKRFSFTPRFLACRVECFLSSESVVPVFNTLEDQIRPLHRSLRFTILSHVS
jgi:hypothetical protein